MFIIFHSTAWRKYLSCLMTKPTKWHVHPAKTQISLGIRTVWSKSSQCAQGVAKDPSFLLADGDDSDQTWRMPRLIRVFAGCTCHFVGFVMRRLRFCKSLSHGLYLSFEPPRDKTEGERGGSVVECRTPEREVRGSRPTAAVLCPWARHFTPRKYWFITQEAMAPSRHDWKIVDWDVKPQHNQSWQNQQNYLCSQ